MGTSGRASHTSAPRIDTFTERVDMLLEELTYSIQAGRPSVLLLPYASEFLRADVEQALEQRLAALGQALVRWPVLEDQFDLPMLLSRRPDRPTAVFSVVHLSRGGGKSGANAYRALNIRRELLVDYRIRALFWLNGKESRQLSRHAPDFWAFRHRVVEFNRPRDINQLDLLGKPSPLALLRTARQAVRLSPGQAEAWLELGNRCLQFGLLPQARRAFLHGLSLAPRSSLGWLGLGQVYRLGGELSDAIINYRQALTLDPGSLPAHIALIGCYRFMGQEALAREVTGLAGPLAARGNEYEQAALASVCGDPPRAVEYLKRALEKRLVHIHQLRHDPNMDFIRNDPAFLEVLSSSAVVGIE